MSLVSLEIEFNPVLFNPVLGRSRLLLTLPYQRLMTQSGAARFLLRLALECQGGPVKINVNDRIHEVTASGDTPLLGCCETTFTNRHQIRLRIGPLRRVHGSR